MITLKMFNNNNSKEMEPLIFSVSVTDLDCLISIICLFIVCVLTVLAFVIILICGWQMKQMKNQIKRYNEYLCEYNEQHLMSDGHPDDEDLETSLLNFNGSIAANTLPGSTENFGSENDNLCFDSFFNDEKNTYSYLNANEEELSAATGTTTDRLRRKKNSDVSNIRDGEDRINRHPIQLPVETSLSKHTANYLQEHECLLKQTCFPRGHGCKTKELPLGSNSKCIDNVRVHRGVTALQEDYRKPDHWQAINGDEYAICDKVGLPCGTLPKQQYLPMKGGYDKRKNLIASCDGKLESANENVFYFVLENEAESYV